MALYVDCRMLYVVDMFRFSPKSRLLARTRSGILLGKVVAIEVDRETGRIVDFLVVPKHMFSVFYDKALVIAWSQVVDWLEEEIIVSDAVVEAESKYVALASPYSP